MKLTILFFIIYSSNLTAQVVKSDRYGTYSILEGDTLAIDTTIRLSRWSNGYNLNVQGYYYYQPLGKKDEAGESPFIYLDNQPQNVGIIDAQLNRITDTVYSGFNFRTSYMFYADLLAIPRGDTLCFIDKKGHEKWCTPFQNFAFYNMGIARIQLPEIQNLSGELYHPVVVMDTLGNIDTLNYQSSSKFRFYANILEQLRDSPAPKMPYRDEMLLEKIETINGKFGLRKVGTNVVYLYPYYDSIKILRISDKQFQNKVICRLNGERIVIYI